MPFRTDAILEARSRTGVWGSVVQEGHSWPKGKSGTSIAVRIDDPTLDAMADSVIVLQNAGPIVDPGMPKWAQLPIPEKLLEVGVRDMVRISDARMSGASYGACMLHFTPESFVGGPLALVHDGDLIELDITARKLDLLI